MSASGTERKVSIYANYVIYVAVVNALDVNKAGDLLI